MKLSDIRVGARYLGPDNEVRAVIRMAQRHGGVVDLEWVSESRKRHGKLLVGKSTPQLFAKWAHCFASPNEAASSKENE